MKKAKSHKPKTFLIKIGTFVFALSWKLMVWALAPVAVAVSLPLIINQTPASTMDIIVKVGDGGGFESGDVIHAINAKRILDIHAQHVVHPKNMTRDSAGRIAPNSLLEFYLERTKEFKFERISKTEVRRTNLWTLQQEVLSDIPNASGEYLYVQLYLDRRLSLKPDQNQIFGSAGSEYWYGGGTRTTDSIMDTIWNEIESKTANVRQTQFPFTETEKKRFLIIKVADMTDSEANALTQPMFDVDGNIINQRAKKLDLSSILNAKEQSDLSNPTLSKDLRSKTKDISNAVITK